MRNTKIDAIIKADILFAQSFKYSDMFVLEFICKVTLSHYCSVTYIIN